MFDEFDSVALTVPLPAHDLPTGARGAIVMVHGNHEAYEVEFLRGERTVALLTLLPNQLRLIQKFAPTPATVPSGATDANDAHA